MSVRWHQRCSKCKKKKKEKLVILANIYSKSTGESRQRKWLQKVVQKKRTGGTEALRDGQPQTTVQSQQLLDIYGFLHDFLTAAFAHVTVLNCVIRFLTGAAAVSWSAGGWYGPQDRAAGPSPAQRETYREAEAPPAETRPWAPGELQEESSPPGRRAGGRRLVWIWWGGSELKQEEKRWCWTDCGHSGDSDFKACGERRALIYIPQFFHSQCNLHYRSKHLGSVSCFCFCFFKEKMHKIA